MSFPPVWTKFCKYNSLPLHWVTTYCCSHKMYLHLNRWIFCRQKIVNHKPCFLQEVCGGTRCDDIQPGGVLITRLLFINYTKKDFHYMWEHMMNQRRDVLYTCLEHAVADPVEGFQRTGPWRVWVGRFYISFSFFICFLFRTRSPCRNHWMKAGVRINVFFSKMKGIFGFVEERCISVSPWLCLGCAVQTSRGACSRPRSHCKQRGPKSEAIITQNLIF